MEGDQNFLESMGFGFSQTEPESPIGEQVTRATQQSSVSVKGKSKKGPNWSSHEDKILIKAWSNTSLDAVTGTDQNGTAYWDRISDYYDAHKQSSWPERNANALSCHYTLIPRETSKFCGCLQQILNRDESGRTIEEKTNDAHVLFREMDPKNKPFTLTHCYVEFSRYPKWETREQETSQKKQKKTSAASPGTASNDEDFRVCTNALENEKRPAGTKAEKERLRRGKAHVSDGSAIKLSLETVWAQKQEKDEIKEAAKNARYAQAFELQKKDIELKEREDARQEREDARKQFELDERVMLMDTSGMTDVQRQFYQQKQNQIIARRLD